MKKIAVIITTALTALLFTAGTIVYAEESNDTSYPQLASTLTFDSLSAYAVNEDETRFAFAQDEYIYVFEGSLVSSGKYSGTLENNGEVLYYYAHTDDVTDLTFYEDNIVFTDGSEVYEISDGKAQSSSYLFSTTVYTEYGSLVYSTNAGNLSVWDGGSGLNSLSDGTYSMLKPYVSSLYVICNNSLCSISATTVSDVDVQTLEFEYVDLSQGETILVGDTAQILAQAATGEYTVTLDAGTYVTQADLSDLSGTYFKTGKSGTFALSEKTEMLYICTSGSVDILYDGQDIYLTASGNTLTSIKTETYASSNAYLNTAANVYSTTYMCDSTLIGTIDADEIVTVNYTIESELLQCGLASVTCTIEGTEVTGYIASNFLTEYYFPAENGSYGEAEYTDEYNEENVIIAVCLVIVIVVLVIAGVAFISYSSGAGKRKKNDQSDDDNN